MPKNMKLLYLDILTRGYKVTRMEEVEHNTYVIEMECWTKPIMPRIAFPGARPAYTSVKVEVRYILSPGNTERVLLRDILGNVKRSEYGRI